MSEQPNIPVSIKRRYHLIERALNNLLPNMYPCDYNSSDHFVEGVLDEIFYYIGNESDFYGVDLMIVNDFILEHKYDELTDYFNEHCIVLKNDYLQESIRRILREVRVPRNERVELYKDDNIIVIVPLTHRALKKYAHQCQWCINDDESEWEDYHKGKHAVIIQRNPKKPKKGITGMETYGEIFILSRLDNGMWDWKTATDILGYDFGGSKERASDYYVSVSKDINNFATNIVYYSPETGIYDQEDNFLWNFNYEISDIPNVTPEVIEIMDDYLQESEEMKLQEHIRNVLREEFDIPQPGESSGKPLSQDEMDFMDCDTDYLTIDEILDGRIQRIPYYREVLQDVMNDDYSWGVTKKVVEYARYMKKNPKSLRNLPPIIVVDDIIQDGAHRISAIYLLQNYMDENNPFWGEIELEVKFCYK